MNPYKVLGVSENATEEEITAAYRKLVKQYHPDKFADEQLKARANEKMQEINAAYEQITRPDSVKGSRYTGSGNREYSSNEYSGRYAQEFIRIEGLITAGKLHEALEALDELPIKSARWHFLRGVVYERMQLYDKAAYHFERAFMAEPENLQYRRAYMDTHRNYNTYRTAYSRTYSSDDDLGCLLCGNCCRVFATVWCCNAMCDCCLRGC